MTLIYLTHMHCTIYLSVLLCSSITANSTDSTVCTCPAPCHRVVYTPDLSYAYLSDATVSKIWKGQSDRLADVTRRYKKAKEIVHRVDPKIVARDQTLFGNVKEVFDNISIQCDKAMMMLQGFITDSSTYFNQPVPTSQHNTLYGTASNSIVSLYQARELKLDKLKSTLNSTITPEAQKFIIDYKNFFQIYQWTPPFNIYIASYLQMCASMQESGSPLQYYCYSPTIPDFTEKFILRMQGFIANTTTLAANPLTKFRRGLNSVFNGNPTLIDEHLQFMNSTSCMATLQDRQMQSVAIFTTLLQNSLNYNETTNFTEKFDITNNIAKNLDDLHYLENSPPCVSPYDQCIGLTNDQTMQLQFSTDYTIIFSTFSNTKLMVQQSGALILNPMFGYLNTTVGTKSELYQLIHSDDFDLNVLQIHAMLIELKKEQFQTVQRSIEILNSELVLVLGSLANCSLTILDQSDFVNLTMLHYIEQNYLQNTSIAAQWAKVKGLSSFNATELAELVNLSFDKQNNDFQTIVDTMLNDTNSFSKYISKVKRNLMEFEDLDSLIMEV